MNRAHLLRRHLIQVLLAGILPVGLFAAALLFLHWQTQEVERRRSQMETTRLLAAAVDNAIESTEQRLSILARHWTLRTDSERELYDAARAALGVSPDWENMLVFKADGSGVFRLDRPFGTVTPSMRLRGYSAAALKEKRPTLSKLFVNSVTGTRVVGVAYPVARGDTVTHVLIASLNLQWFDSLLNRQRLPPGGIAGIFDGDMKFIARSHDGEARRGADPAPGLHELMRANAEGLDRFPSLDGDSVYTSWTRTPRGWIVAFATPATPIDGALWRTVGLLCAMLAAVILAGILFAALRARKITASFDETLQAVERLRQAEGEGRAAAEAANRAKDEFLAMLGHELRNPLAAVSNAVAIIRAPERTPQQLEFAADIIHRQCGHLKRLIDDLLDVGRVVTGKIAPDRRPLDLSASVQHVVATLRTAGTFARHTLEVHAGPAWINGDHTRIEQIISNLLVNAAVYTPPGGRIELSLAQENETAVLRVRDEGKGITAEALPRIFDLFFQGGQHGGLGIGLTLVKRLVELHGGSVLAESAGPGTGATFTVRLPATSPRAVQAKESAAHVHEARTVLVVEDNADTRDSLRVALELRGHRVLHAADAQSALAEVRSGRPSIAFIDIGLPGMDGYGLAREIRERYSQSIALVALTGYGSGEDVRRAREAGFCGHLTKPVEVGELAAIVARTVS
jgi:signal transduction histidine kinase/CheY-like chemotaxis protein